MNRTGNESTAGLRADADLVAGLRTVSADRRELEALASDVETGQARSSRAAVVCLVGPTGAGKSTLLNALAAREIAVEGEHRPTTSEPVVYAPADLLAADRPEVGQAKWVDYAASAERWWSGHVLIDAPDLNSVVESHHRTVAALAETADVLLVVFHDQSIFEKATLEFIDRFAGRRRLALVLNRADRLDEEARRSLREQLQQLAAERWPQPPAEVFVLSALRAKQDADGEPEFAALVAWLRALVEDGTIDGVRRANRSGAQARAAGLYARARERVGGQLEELSTALREAWTLLGRRVAEEVDRRVRARRRDIESMLTYEVAKGWRGPGGWLLRWGVAGAVAGLTVRRHPLAAATMAAGGKAIDALTRELASGRLDAALVTPPAAEIEAWAGEALRASRMAADRILEGGLAEEAFEAAPVVVRLSTSVADAWDTALSRDLAERASSGALRWVPILFDLPLYALGAHVGWRTLSTYLVGEILPLDYYAHAGALAFLVALLSHLGARGVIALAARRWATRLAASLAQAVHVAIDDAALASSAHVDVVSEALVRLSDGAVPLPAQYGLADGRADGSADGE